MTCLLRGLAGLSGLALAAAIVWAMGEKSLWDSFPAIVADPWGLVTIIDLYIGFVLMAIVIAVVEPVWWRAALWILPMPFLGNLVPALWLVLRAGHLVRLARRAPDGV